MIIYTVVGLIDYEGIGHLFKSFTNKEDAQHFVSECVKYDETEYIAANIKSVDSRKAWASNHPVGFDPCCNGYEIEEHELVGGDE